MFQNGLFTRILQRILRDTVHGIYQERYHYHRHFKSISKPLAPEPNYLRISEGGGNACESPLKLLILVVILCFST